MKSLFASLLTFPFLSCFCVHTREKPWQINSFCEIGGIHLFLFELNYVTAKCGQKYYHQMGRSVCAKNLAAKFPSDIPLGFHF